MSPPVHNLSPIANYERGEQKSSQVSEVSEQALLIFSPRLGGVEQGSNMTGSDQIQSVFLWNREEVALLEAIMRTGSRAELHARVAEPEHITPDTYTRGLGAEPVGGKYT